MKSSFDSTREVVSSIVNESRLPNNYYESTVGFYGGKLVEDSEGKIVYNMEGIISKADRFGDKLLRAFDEHIIKNPLEMLKRHPKLFLKFLLPDTKRYRRTPDKILENVEKLGLNDYYGAHKNGIEIKKPELFSEGFALQDIYRADEINSDRLNDIDRFQALEESGKYIRHIHDNGGPVGELLSSDIIFESKEEDGKLINPVLNIPDIVYEKDLSEKVPGIKQSSEAYDRDRKATDILDFTFQVGVEELRRSGGDWDSVAKAITTVLENYSDKDVIEWVRSFAKRGRITLVGKKESLDELSKSGGIIDSALSQHNRARMGSNNDFEGDIRNKIIEVCDRYLMNNK